MKKNIYSLAIIASMLFMASCSDDDDFVPPVDGDQEVVIDDEGVDQDEEEQDQDPVDATTTFSITVTNSINYLYETTYGGDDNPLQNRSENRSNPTRGSLDTAGEFFEIDFVAAPGIPGARMSFVSMSSISNDWLFAPEGQGIAFYDDNDQPILGDVTGQIRLWDAGTEATNMLTFGGAGEDGEVNLREDDDDNTVRIIQEDVSDLIRAEITEFNSDTNTFTLVITNLVGESLEEAPIDNPIRVSPGILVLHAQENPFFTAGEPDREQGLQQIAERGNTEPLDLWFNEEGTDGVFTRIASSWSTISPGLVYAFDTELDPWFTQGEAMTAGSGLEELAEAGNNQVASEYLANLGFPVATSEQTTNLVPGESLTFTLEVPTDSSYKLGFGTMLTRTNDWFLSFNNNGVLLYEEDLTPFTGISESDEIYLFDAGTEADELVGIGEFLGSTEGPEDANTIIRRVGSIEDGQFGKGTIVSGPGTAWIGDPRGGYNLLEIDIQVQ